MHPMPTGMAQVKSKILQMDILRWRYVESGCGKAKGWFNELSLTHVMVDCYLAEFRAKGKVQ